jgi:predicted ATPase/two-component SAPR family response regulator
MSLMIDPLPVRLSPLVGRTSELRDIMRTIEASRLLTLTGPGGTGKTRLALATAAEVAAGDRATCWVELAAIDDPGIVARTVAARLGVPDTPGQDATTAMTTHIAGEVLMLVLDNCEHLAGAAASLSEDLLAVCPNLTILATSREPLGVDGERTWPVPPLASTDAMRLFEQRARLVRPEFRVTADNAEEIQFICQRLDGLPLAIELAAARMRILSAAELAGRLDDIFTVLTGGARSAPRRHQALRATLDWSHDLLCDDERAGFRRLSVFSGGFTLDAAEHVIADGSEITSTGVMDLLTRLADKSLLRAEHTCDVSRYYLLATIRDYAATKLAGTADEAPTRRAHLLYYTQFAERAAAHMDTELDQVDAELHNLRTAVEYALKSGDCVPALTISSSLGRYASLRGQYHEIRQWLDAAVTSCPDAPAALRARALLGGGRLALLQCDYAPAVRRGEAALRLCREEGDARGTASALQLLGSVAREQGRYARAAQLYAESLADAEVAGDRRAAASVHNSLAFISWLQGDFDSALMSATTSLEMFRALSDIEGIASALTHLGVIARFKSDNERAVALLTEARSLSDGIGFREGIAWAQEQLGLIAAQHGDPGAVGLLRSSLETHTELRDRWRMSSLLEDLAAVALAQQNARRAARLLGAAEAIRDAIGSVIAPVERPQHGATVSGAKATLGVDGFEAARQWGLLATAEDLRADLPRAGARIADSSMALPVLAAPAPVPAHRDNTGTLRIRALGGAVVEIGDTALTAADWGYAKPRELLFLLATSPAMTRDQIGAALWPDLSGRQLSNALHTALRELRRALGDAGWVRYADGRYRFDRTREHECDVTTFEDAVAAARAARPATAGLPDLQRAIAAYGGDFLDGMPAGEWALVRRDELRRAFESALLASGRMLSAAGRYQAAATAFRRAVAHEPLNESAHRELMACWAQLGETARAVRHYEELAKRLHDQLGVPPAAETTALYRVFRGVQTNPPDPPARDASRR